MCVTWRKKVLVYFLFKEGGHYVFCHGLGTALCKYVHSHRILFSMFFVECPIDSVASIQIAGCPWARAYISGFFPLLFITCGLYMFLPHQSEIIRQFFIHTHTRTHTHTHTHSLSLTHTHTHTHTCSLSHIYSLPGFREESKTKLSEETCFVINLVKRKDILYVHVEKYELINKATLRFLLMRQ